MNPHYLQLAAHDPVVARDGRPFGVGQGRRMKGLDWLYPSVVAGSFRSALVKARGGDFTGGTREQIQQVPVAGFFPVAEGELYLPAPNDCVVEATWRTVEGEQVKEYVPHRALPERSKPGEGCDWPDGLPLWPVLIRRDGDFKPAAGPAWWPATQLADWLAGNPVTFDRTFLCAPTSQARDHVQLDADTGAATEGRLFTTAGLSLTHLPRFGAPEGNFADRFAPITLTVRTGDALAGPILHPLGGERRLVHWKPNGSAALWRPPPGLKAALAGPGRVRLLLATPAVFKHGWRPDWLATGLPPGCAVKLRLVGVSIPRWKAVSGWSLAPPKPGPKAIRRLVPAGGVYFFETDDDRAALVDRWLQSVSDNEQDRNDGFGLAAWGTWDEPDEGGNAA